MKIEEGSLNLQVLSMQQFISQAIASGLELGNQPHSACPHLSLRYPAIVHCMLLAVPIQQPGTAAALPSSCILLW